MRSKTSLAVLAASLLLFAACNAAATPTGTPAPSQAASQSVAASPSGSAATAGCTQGAGSGGQTVTIKNFAFSPADLTISAGTTVTFTNNDNATHTATADDGSFDCGPISNGQSFSFTFSTAGSFAFHCKIHPSMTAKITVS